MPHVIATDGCKAIRFVPIPDRAPVAGEVRLRTLLSGISQGTELRQYRNSAPRLIWDDQLRVYEGEDPNPLPRYLGYENVAEIVELGSDCAGLSLGDVVWTPTPHQDTVVVPAKQARDGLLCKSEERESIEGRLPLFTCCARARIACAGLHDAEVLLGERIAVFGLGLVGCFIVQACLLSGASAVYAVDPCSARLNFCESVGAIPVSAADAGWWIKQDSHGGVDKAIEASGVIGALHQAVRACCAGGTVVTVGTYNTSGEGLFLGNEWSKNRITMRSSMTVNGCSSRSHPLWNLSRLQKLAIDLLREGSLRLPDYSTECFAFSRAHEAYRAADLGSPPPVHLFLRYGM